MSGIYFSLVGTGRGLSLSRLFSLMLFVLFAATILWCNFTVSSLHFGLISFSQVSNGSVLPDSFDPFKEAIVMDEAAIVLVLIAMMMIVIVTAWFNTQKDYYLYNVRLAFVERKLLRFCDSVLRIFCRGIIYSQIY